MRPSLQRIRDKTDNSVALAVLSDLDVLFLVYVSTKQLTRIVAGVGTRFPAYATSAGRVLPAYTDKCTVDDYFSKVHMEALTEKTVATKKEMKSILSNVKKNRYSSTEGELDFGVVSVAVPVFNEEQKIIASISCSTASARTTEQKMIEEIVPELQEAAREIEFELRRCPMLAHSIIS